MSLKLLFSQTLLTFDSTQPQLNAKLCATLDMLSGTRMNEDECEKYQEKPTGRLDLKPVLLNIHQNPYPPITNPPGCKRRAAVACIIRVRPAYPDVPHDLRFEDHSSFESVLNSFFAQPWVQRGEPEILFIKRAIRHGDRFTGHVAFPGGKREAGDATDEATAARETAEEVGLDLRAPGVLLVGPLPERIVATEWGTTPLMVLCPFVYLATRYALPPLRLQPREVGSAHWVTVRALLDPALHTHERADVADRLARRRGWPVKVMLRLLLGKMLYAGIRLLPSESIFEAPTSAVVPRRREDQGPLSILAAAVAGLGRADSTIEASYPERRLCLWGLTHGIVADLLSLISSRKQLDWWFWPTLSAPDVRLLVWLCSYGHRSRKIKSISLLHSPASPSKKKNITKGRDIRTSAVWTTQDDHGLDQGNSRSLHEQGPRVIQHSAVTYLLDGYYEIIKRGVFAALGLRLGFLVAIVMLVARSTDVRAKLEL